MKIVRLSASSCLLATVLLILGLASGCSEGGPANSVSGKVTLNGDPVTGTIVFVGSGKEATSSIGLTGEYFISDPPLGDVSVLIKPNTSIPAPVGGAPGNADSAAMPGMPSVKAAATPPAKYADASSGLKYTVAAGKQKKDFELAP
jgi:hypothetical protein